MGTVLRLFVLALFLLWLASLLRRLLRPPSQGRPKTSGSKDHYSVLGISKGATREEIKKAYKESISKYHPDKVEHLGEDIKELSRKKTHEIQAAYEALMR